MLIPEGVSPACIHPLQARHSLLTARAVLQVLTPGRVQLRALNVPWVRTPHLSGACSALRVVPGLLPLLPPVQVA